MTSLQDDPDAKRARELAAEARAFLDAEGFSNERIDELARAFVAGPRDEDEEGERAPATVYPPFRVPAAWWLAKNSRAFRVFGSCAPEAVRPWPRTNFLPSA